MNTTYWLCSQDLAQANLCRDGAARGGLGSVLHNYHLTVMQDSIMWSVPQVRSPFPGDPRLLSQAER